MSKGKRNQTSKKNNNNIKKKIEEVNGDFSSGIWNKVFVVIGVLCFILVFYLLTLYLTNKGDTTSYKTTPSEATISYTKIIAGRSFSVDDGEYLVVYYNEGEDTSIDDAVHTYRNNNILKLYSVDMNDPINTKYKSDSSNPNLTNATELKINGPTLIKFNNKKVEEYIEGTDSIIDYLN